MKTINDYFDKILVLTVGATNDRIESLRKRLNGLDFEIFEGIDGNKILPEIESINLFPKDFFPANEIDFDRFEIMSKGQLGCSLSHLKIYEHIVSSSLKRTLILEDDAFINVEDLPLFKILLQEIPDDWELFYLGYKDVVKYQRRLPLIFQMFYHRIKNSKIYKMQFGRSVKAFYSSKQKNFLTGGVYLATYGYAISLEGAKKALEYSKPVRFLADELLMDMVYHNKIRSVVAPKPLINHSYNFQSTT